MLLKKLFRTLWQYKAQFISMVIMVALGIGVFLGFNVEWYSLEVNTKEIYDATGFADFRIYSDKGFSPEDLEAVKGIDGVDDATRFLSLNVSVKDDTDTLALTVTENSSVSGVLVMEGEPYNAEDPDGFWLSDSYAAANGIKVGDPLTLTYQMITVKGTVKSQRIPDLPAGFHPDDAGLFNLRIRVYLPGYAGQRDPDDVQGICRFPVSPDQREILPGQTCFRGSGGQGAGNHAPDPFQG